MQRLKSLLSGKLPLMEDGFTPRLDFYPKITNDKIGGGSFCLVQRTYKRMYPQNKHLPLKVWVDCDIYIRNEGANEIACAKGYAAKGKMPDFNFMVMNFEDFVAMHFDDAVFDAWKCEMENAGHFMRPLHGKDYAPRFEKIWQQYLLSIGSRSNKPYAKGSLPEDFVTIESLKNMIQHCNDEKLEMLFAKHVPAGAFPQFLAEGLRGAYPEVFG